MGKSRLFPEKSADELLKEFVETGAQPPFEEIVRRYAGMVYSVCYRVAQSSHDAEDATQAVFLSLALQAKTGKPIHYIGPWLQRVAHRLALDVKKSKTRRKKREEKLAEINGNGQAHRIDNPADAPQDDELKRIMQEELSSMPAKYRMPLILHYFGGMNREEMAKELNCKPATLGVRVHRGRAMLGKRLAKRGMAIGASLPFVLEEVLHASMPADLVVRTASRAIAVAAHSNGNGAAAAFAATHAIAIARIAAKAVMYAKVRAAIAIMLVASIATTLAGPTVVQSVKEMRLRLQVPWDLRNLVRPLLKALTPARQVNNQPAQAQPIVVQSTPAPAIQMQPELSLPMVAPLPVAVASNKPAQVEQTLTLNPATGNRLAPAKEQNPALAHRDAIQSVGEWLTPMPAPQSGKSLPVGAGIEGVGAVASSGKAAGNPNANPSVDAPIDVSTGHLTLGGGSGTPAHYVMPSNANITTRGTTIGAVANGFGYFRQTGGNHDVQGDLVLGKEEGSTGIYEQTGGTLTAAAEIIGDKGKGIFTQTGGTNSSTHVAMGNAVSGTGTYTLEGDGVLNGGDLTVGVRGKGTLNQNGGKVVLSSYTFGPYASDYFPADETQPATIDVAKYASADGTFALKRGTVFFSGGQKDPTVRIGYQGDGSWQIGDSKTTASISEGSLVRTNLIVRASESASGTLTGWGDVKFRGTLVNNDKIIADGFNVDHTLDLSHFSAIENNIENPTEGGTHGWHAKRKGALKLPPLHVKTGSGTYTWGESDIDPVLDLVNAVRFTVHDATNAGEVNITLLSPDRDDLPRLPKIHRFIGVWAFDPTDVDALGGYDFTIRYDDHLAKSLGIDESVLKFWAYEPDGVWHRIKDDTFHRDIDNNLIGAHADSLTFFAVSAPEPSGVTLLVVGAGLVLRRRRKNV